MSDMNVSLILRLVDMTASGASSVRRGLSGIRKTLSEIRSDTAKAIREGFTAANVDASIAQLETGLNRARGRLVGAFGQGLALYGLTRGLTEFETRLVDFGNTAGIFGDDLAGVETRLRAMGGDVNRTAAEMLTALEILVGKGLDPSQALDALEAVGLTATATHASVEDMADAGFSVIDNLKVLPAELQAAYDAMAQAGRSGGFELKAMAQYFPSLTASAQALKMQGVPAVAELAAALQVAMKGAGNEGEAANNMLNFLSKLSSPETVKRFKDAGIDVQAEFEKASASGVSVFEHMLTLIDKVTEGDQFKMGELFGDQQVLAFLRPMMANMEEFRRIRDEALAGEGVNAEAFGRNMETAAEKIKAAIIAIEDLTTRAGPLLDMVKDGADAVRSVVRQIDAFARANPELTKTLVQMTAGLMMASIGLRVLSFATMGARLGLVSLLGFFLRFNEAGRNVALGWRLIAGAGSMLSFVFSVLSGAATAVAGALATVSAPMWAIIGAIVAVVAAAGLLIWKFWDRISSFVSGFAAGIGEALRPALDAISNFVAGLGEMVGLTPERVQAISEAIGKAFDFSGLIEGAKQAFDQFWSWLGGIFTQEKLSEGEKGAMYQAGAKMGKDLIDGIVSFVTAGVEQIKALFSFKIDWQPPDWLASMMGMPQAPALQPGDPAVQKIPVIRPTGNPFQPFGVDMQTPEIKQTISASVTDDRPPSVTVHAPITITGVTNPNAAANQAATQLGQAIANARTGALHGGTE